MSPRQLIVLAVALVAAVGAVLLVRFNAPAPPPAQEPASAPRGEQVLVAARAVEQGAALSSRDLAWRLFPADSIGERFITESRSPQGLRDAQGAVALRPFSPGEPIVASAIAQRGAGGLLAAQLPQGYRAVAIRIDDEHAVAGYINPNDRVDVILTVTLEGDRGRGGSGERMRSDVLLEDVRVLAVGDATSPSDREAPQRQDSRTAVLELSQFDASTLAMAAERGTLRLVLRGVEAEPPGFRAPSAQRWRSSALDASGEGSGVRIHAFGAVRE